MKKTFLVIAIAITGHFSYAQTNTFPSSGNVGIGTTNAYTQLTVGSGLNFSSTAIAAINTSNANKSAIVLSNWIGSVTSYGPKIVFDNSAFGDWYVGSTDSANSFDISRTWGTPDLRINAFGNISIGSVDPQGYKLAVNGSAIATSMTVKLYGNWPDYVFKPAYHLPSLTEIQTYINLNHHLPNLPSEQEVAKDGLNLGEMNKLLTKKVEEMTLYLIEQNKQLTMQKSTNKAQLNRLDAQQGEINQLKKQLADIAQTLSKK